MISKLTLLVILLFTSILVGCVSTTTVYLTPTASPNIASEAGSEDIFLSQGGGEPRSAGQDDDDGDGGTGSHRSSEKTGDLHDAPPNRRWERAHINRQRFQIVPSLAFGELTA